MISKSFSQRHQLLSKAANLQFYNFFPIAEKIMFSKKESLPNKLRDNVAKLALKGRKNEHARQHWRAYLNFFDAGLTASLVATLLDNPLAKAKIHECSANFYLRGLKNMSLVKNPYDRMHAVMTYSSICEQSALASSNYKASGKTAKAEETKLKGVFSGISGLAGLELIRDYPTVYG